MRLADPDRAVHCVGNCSNFYCRAACALFCDRRNLCWRRQTMIAADLCGDPRHHNLLCHHGKLLLNRLLPRDWLTELDALTGMVKGHRQHPVSGSCDRRCRNNGPKSAVQLRRDLPNRARDHRFCHIQRHQKAAKRVEQVEALTAC